MPVERVGNFVSSTQTERMVVVSGERMLKLPELVFDVLRCRSKL
jgi:hypothetical protein